LLAAQQQLCLPSLQALQEPSTFYFLLPRLEHVTVVHLGEPPSHPRLAVCQSLPAGVLQQRIANIYLSVYFALVDKLTPFDVFYMYVLK
jgi:hypothetical protein